MRVIIAGSRKITSPKYIKHAVKLSEFEITEIISGNASGVDRLGEQFAKENNIPVKIFKADWNDITVPGAIVKVNKFGKEYNSRAGHLRNKQMADYAEGLIAIWDGISPGTKNMILESINNKIKVFVYEVDKTTNKVKCSKYN